MIQHFGFRSSGQPKAIGERAAIGRESFGDIPRAGADRITELLDAPVMPLEVRGHQEQVDAEIEEVRQLPGGNIAEVGGSGHAGRRCNRVAAVIREESRVFYAMCPEEGEEIETRRARRGRKYCR